MLQACCLPSSAEAQRHKNTSSQSQPQQLLPLPLARHSAAPLEALRVQRLKEGAGHLAAFAGTLRHLGLADLPYAAARQQPLSAHDGAAVRSSTARL